MDDDVRKRSAISLQKTALVKAGAALALLWDDVCTVIVRKQKIDPHTKITGFVETTLFQGQPCKLSFEALSTTNGDHVATVEQKAKLFISADLDIPAGSKMIVTHKGRAFTFTRSSEPGVFSYHQEIMLEAFRRWA